MKTPEMPSEGGSYTRDPSGKLVKTQPETKPGNAANAKPKPGKPAKEEA